MVKKYVGDDQKTMAPKKNGESDKREGDGQETMAKTIETVKMERYRKSFAEDFDEREPVSASEACYTGMFQ